MKTKCFICGKGCYSNEATPLCSACREKVDKGFEYSVYLEPGNEVNLAPDGSIIAEYQCSSQVMPHLDEILDAMIKNFNNLNIERYLDIPYRSYISTIQMKKSRKVHTINKYIEIVYTLTPGAVPSQELYDYLDEFMSAQFSDGWGEGFFYPAYSWVAKDGTIIAVI